MRTMNFITHHEQTICKGETICGDAVDIMEDPENSIIHVAVVDGLGHGPAANIAATAFIDYFRTNTRAEISLSKILAGASTAISKTRGVAACIFRLNGEKQTIEYAGVGNVELIALSASPIRPISKSGIVGRRIGQIPEFKYDLHAGDLLTVFTDGISSRFNIASYRDMSPATVCKQIISQWGKEHDDATVIAIQCR